MTHVSADGNLPPATLTTATEPAGPATKRAKAEVNEAKQQHTTVFSYVLWCFGVLPLEAGCHTNITPDVGILCNPIAAPISSPNPVATPHFIVPLAGTHRQPLRLGLPQ